MAEPVTVARPYAEAVFKLANESNALSTWADALANVDGVVADARVQACITDPNVSAQRRAGAGGTRTVGSDAAESLAVRGAQTRKRRRARS